MDITKDVNLFKTGYGYDDGFRYIRNLKQKRIISDIFKNFDPYCLDMLDNRGSIPDGFRFRVSQQRIENSKSIIIPTLIYKQTSDVRNHPLYFWMIILNFIPSNFSFNYVSAPGMYQSIARFINIYKSNVIDEGSPLSYYHKDDHDALFLANILIPTLLHDYTYSNHRVPCVGIISNSNLNMLPFFEETDDVRLYRYGNISYSRELADSMFSSHCSSSVRFYHKCSSIYSHVFSSKDNIDMALRLFGRLAWAKGYDGQEINNNMVNVPESIQNDLSSLLGIKMDDLKPNSFCFDFPCQQADAIKQNVNKSDEPFKIEGSPVRKYIVSDSTRLLCINPPL